MEETIYRLEYNSRQEEFHFAFPSEPGNPQWPVIMAKIPGDAAIEFTGYAHKKLLRGKRKYSWLEMRRELHKWLERKYPSLVTANAASGLNTGPEKEEELSTTMQLPRTYKLKENIFRMEYNSRQRMFNLASLSRPLDPDWPVLKAKIHAYIAVDFVDYAAETLLSDNKYCSWLKMRKEFYKWLGS